MLELCDIELGFSAVPLFSGLNLTIAPGEISFLTAPSGAGKSSLLRWMAGLQTPGLHASGQVRLGGQILKVVGVGQQNRFSLLVSFRSLNMALVLRIGRGDS